MLTCCLVLDLHATGVCVAIARFGAESHLIADVAGRVVHPLDSPLLWGGEDDRSNRVELVANFLQLRDDSLADVPTVKDAFVYLLYRIKAFAESRLEHDASDVLVLLPHQFSPRASELVKAWAIDAGFRVYRRVRRPVTALMAYELDTRSGEAHAMVVDVSATHVDATIWNIEEGIFELVHASHVTRGTNLRVDVECAVEAVLRTSGFARDRIDHVVFTGAIASESAATVGIDVVLDQLPAAILENAFEPSQACAVGGMAMMRRHMAPRKDSEVIYCFVPTVFTIGLEIADGVCEPLFPRNVILPTTRRTRVRVFSSEHDGTVELRFCEGERDVFAGNFYLGALRIDGLQAG